MNTATLIHQRQAIEGALRALSDRKIPRSSELAAITAGLAAAIATIRGLEQGQAR